MAYKKEDFIGVRFKSNQGGECEVVDFKGCYDVTIKFLDEHSYTYRVTLGELRAGEIKNPYHPNVYGVGYIGVGEFKPTFNGKNSLSYTCWISMLERNYCYDKSLRFPTYAGCTVCEEWHNFQNFAEWYEKQEFYGLGYQLDKDILVEGNKVYHPNMCALVPPEINNLIIRPDKSKSKYPTGVCIKKSTGKFLVQLKRFGKQTHVGYFKDLESAVSAYKKEKELYVKEVANLWKGKIPEDVYLVLINWEFKEIYV